MQQRVMSLTGAAIFGAWVIALGFRPVTNNDFWFHLKVGEDILATHSLLRVDVYSSVAQGRPFLDQGWLAAVALALIYRNAGPAAVSLLGTVAGVVTAILCYWSVPRALRNNVLTLPLLGLCFYLTDFAIAVRPVTFAIPILAVFALSLERWRQTRRMRDLVALVPLQVLWTNVHGSFLFGPLLLWTVAACCAALAMAPGLQRVPGETSYRWLDVRNLVFIAVGCSAAMFVTPYGAASLAVTLETWGTNEVVRRTMTEWHGPFDAASYFRAHFQYLFWAYLVLLFLLGGALALRVSERPLLDGAIVAVTVYLSVEANRFIPYAAIFGFPVLARSYGALSSHVKEFRGRSLLGAAVQLMSSAVLLAGTIYLGYPYGTDAYGKLGWGIAERMPRTEAAFILERGWSGMVYNEVMTDGSYLLYALHPRVRPAMDAHLGGGEEALAEYDATRSSPSLLSAYLAKYDVRLALVVPDGWIANYLLSKSWQTALRTPNRLLLVRQ